MTHIAEIARPESNILYGLCSFVRIFLRHNEIHTTVVNCPEFRRLSMSPNSAANG